MTFERAVSIVVPVFNAEAQAQATVNAFFAQALPAPIELIIVDDGSAPPLRITTPSLPNLAFRLKRLMENQGRGSACNAGVAESRAAYITFLDVDCVPQEDFVANLTVEIARGAPLIFGHIRFASGDAFFDRYENSVQLRRRSAMDSWATSLTSANVTLRRELVLAVGGFNNVYRHYGFEDRDLFLRLQRAFPDIHPVYSDACLVEHVDRPQLAVIESKFERSGRFTARRFRSDHADAYRRIPVSHFDARYSRILRSAPDWSLKSGVWALHPIVRWLFHLCHDREWDQLAAFALKVLKGLAFMRGTLSE